MAQFLEKYFECEQERVPSGNIHRPNPASLLAKDAGYPAKLAGWIARGNLIISGDHMHLPQTGSFRLT